MITPAISVLSAVEGLGVATPALASWVDSDHAAGCSSRCLPCNSRGPRASASFSGRSCRLVRRRSPRWAAHGRSPPARGDSRRRSIPSMASHSSAARHFLEALLLIGALMLVVTGGEAMYADVGHFGAFPIRHSWFAVVYPALHHQLPRTGSLRDGRRTGRRQQAVLRACSAIDAHADGRTGDRRDQSSRRKPSFPAPFLWLRRRSGLGLFPRLDILHTHSAREGQVYIAAVNWGLLDRLRGARRVISARARRWRPLTGWRSPA